MDVTEALELLQAIVEQPRAGGAVHAVNLQTQFALAVLAKVCVAAQCAVSVEDRTVAMFEAGRLIGCGAKRVVAFQPLSKNQTGRCRAAAAAKYALDPVDAERTHATRCAAAMKTGFERWHVAVSLVGRIAVLKHHIGGVHGKISADAAADHGARK